MYSLTRGSIQLLVIKETPAIISSTSTNMLSIKKTKFLSNFKNIAVTYNLKTTITMYKMWRAKYRCSVVPVW